MPLKVLFILLSFAFPVRSEELTIDGKTEVPQYAYAELTVKVEAGGKAIWKVFPAPVMKTDRGDGMLQFAGLPGTAYTADVTVINFEKKTVTSSEKLVTFLGNSPEPPNPIPPVDGSTPFTKALKTAYLSEPAEEQPLMENLSVFYNQAAIRVQAAETWGKLFEDMAKAAVEQGTAGKLHDVQTVISLELKRVLPWKGAADMKIDAKGKATARSTFKRIAKDLEKIIGG